MPQRAVLYLWREVQVLLGYGFILTILDKCFQAYSIHICCTDPSFVVVVVYFSKVFMNYILGYLFCFIVFVFFFKNSNYKYVSSPLLSSMSIISLQSFKICSLSSVLFDFLISVFTVFPIMSNLSLCSFQSHLDLWKGFFPMASFLTFTSSQFISF